MKGRVTGFDPTTYKGMINGEDGKRYDFVMQDWRGTGKPRIGIEVDFQSDGASAREIYPLSQTAETNATSFAGVLFSFQGRISRKTFWLTTLALIAVGAVAGGIIGGIAGATAAADGAPDPGDDFSPAFVIPVLILLFFNFWTSLALQIKRWHDRNKTGWFVLLGFIPIIGWIWEFVEIGFLRGTQGDNDYGPDPLIR